MIRCSVSLASTSARVSREPTSGMSGFSRSRYGHRADVVLVPVGQDDRLDVVEPVPDVVEVGQDQVDAGLVASGNSTPQSTISSRPPYSKTVMLRPISPRPPRATMRSAPSAAAAAVRARGAGGSCGQLLRRRRDRSCAARATSASVASTSGSRTGPRAGRAGQRGLRQDHALRAGHDPATRQQLQVELAGAADVAGAEGSIISRSSVADDVPDHTDEPRRRRPRASGRLSVSSPE